MKPNDDSVQRTPSQNGYPRDYSSMEPFQSCSQIKVITLRRKGANMPLGFSIRGGWEHGTGVFVSEVQPGSVAQRQGLRVGDQIVRVNGFSIHRAIHMEVLSLLKTCPGVVLKVKRVGVLPVKERRKDPVTWKVVDSHSVLSQHSRDNSRFNEYIPENCVIVKIEFSVLGSTSLGCSIAKGPPEMPGIFMCTVKDGGVADEAGLEVGDQIMDMNGTSFFDIKLADAVALMKSTKDIKLTVKKRAGISLFSEQQSSRNPPPLLINGHESNKNGPSRLESPQRRQCSVLKEHDFSGSNSSKSEEESSFRSSDSEKDYSISEESGIHSLKPSQNGHHTNGRHKKSASVATTTSGGSSSDDTTNRVDGSWIVEEKRRLENEQKKLLIEKQRLEEEKRRLEQLEKSSGSSSCASSSSEEAPHAGGGFLEELQKVAAKMSIKGDRTNIDELLMERRNGEKTTTLKREKGKVKDEEDVLKRRQHEMLMEEFRQAHRKMFGQNGDAGTNGKVNDGHSSLKKAASTSCSKPSPPVPPKTCEKTKITVNGQNPSIHSQTLPRPERTVKLGPRLQTSIDDMDGSSSKTPGSTTTHQVNFRVTFDTKRPATTSEHDRQHKNSLVEVTPWNTRL